MYRVHTKLSNTYFFDSISYSFKLGPWPVLLLRWYRKTSCFHPKGNISAEGPLLLYSVVRANSLDLAQAGQVCLPLSPSAFPMRELCCVLDVSWLVGRSCRTFHHVEWAFPGEVDSDYTPAAVERSCRMQTGLSGLSLASGTLKIDQPALCFSAH
jgi:hypothetical protein